MALLPGTRLGRYEIVAFLGAGGMGEVYRAHDATLRRDVAIKVLLAQFAGDADRLKRFEREALATAALSHPNILAVYDVGNHDGVTFVVSELLDGVTLRDRLAHGPMPSRQAVKYAAQVADGLAAAHAKGIVHRDLKPANLFITTDDRIKILDFGLARILDDSPLDDGLNATTTASLTAPGTLLGSAGYMSPEQVRGQPADHRADIFSLGAVLYEMLSGRRAFHRDTVAGTLSAIVDTDPPSSDGDGSPLSRRVMRIVRRCLEKAPSDRLQSARDLALVLADESSDSAPALPAAARPVSRYWIKTLLIAVAAAALGAWGWAQRDSRAERSASPTTVAIEIAVPDQAAWDSQLHPVVSNDGSRIAMTVRRNEVRRLYVRDIGELGTRLLPGTEGANQPFFSPDGREIAFFADQQLKVVGVDGTAIRVVCAAPSPRGGSWGDDNFIVFAADIQTRLSRVRASGGTSPEPLTTLQPGETGHRFPHVLPQAAGVVFTSQRADGGYAVAAIAPGSRQHSLLVTNARSPSFAQGRLLFMNDQRELTTVPFDATALRVTGAPAVQPERGTAGSNLGDSSFSVARDGTLVYLPFESPLREMGVIGRDGHYASLPGIPRNYHTPRLSPDGMRVAVSVVGARSFWGDVWITDLAGGFTRLTADDRSQYPTWNSRGDLVAFTSLRLGLPAIFAQSLTGGTPVQLTQAGGELRPITWRDQERLLQVGSFNLRAGFESIATVSLAQMTPLPVAVLLPLPGIKTSHGRVSPDGKWLAYTTDESGEWEVYVTRFLTPNVAQSVSRGESGSELVWAPSGRELYFRRASGQLVVAPIAADGRPGPVRPVNTGDVTIGRGGPGSPYYDVFPDGRLLVLKTVLDRQLTRPVVVVVNWLNGSAKK